MTVRGVDVYTKVAGAYGLDRGFVKSLAFLTAYSPTDGNAKTCSLEDEIGLVLKNLGYKPRELVHGDQVEIGGLGVGSFTRQGAFTFWVMPCTCGCKQVWRFPMTSLGVVTDLNGVRDENLTKRVLIQPVGRGKVPFP